MRLRLQNTSASICALFKSPRYRAASFNIALCLLMSLLVANVNAQDIQMFGTELEAFGDFYSVDVTDGSITTLGQSSSFFAGMDFDAKGNLWGATTSLGRIDPTDGSVFEETLIDFIDDTDGFDVLTGLTFSPDGQLYGVGNLSGRIWNINTETAEAVLVHDFGIDMFAIEFSADGTLYGAALDLYELDLDNLSSTLIGNVGQLVNGMDFAASGVMYGVSEGNTTDSLYTIDLQTGASQVIGVTGGNITGLASLVIPEPSSTLVLILSLAAITNRRRTQFRW